MSDAAYYVRRSASPILVFLATALLAFGFSYAQNNNEKASKDGDFDAALIAESREDRTKAFEKVFDKYRLDKLCALRDERFSGIAMRAAWERVIESTPAKTPNASYPVNNAELSRFVGFCEGRIQSPLPAWWSETLLSAKADGRAAIGFSLPGACTYEHVDGELYCSPGTRLVRNGPVTTITAKKESFEIPKNRIDSARKTSGTRVVPLIEKKTVFMAEHSAWCSPYYVHCMDRKTGKQLWQAYVLTAGTGFGWSARSDHFVSLAVTDDRLLVFGGSPEFVYLEAFSISDGKLLYRFCTP